MMERRSWKRKCGSNTEIFWDYGASHSCGVDCRPGCKCGRFLEISNSLFIDRYIDAITGQIGAMEKPFAETVIGTERTAVILQDRRSVFDIDVFGPLIDLIKRRCTVAESERLAGPDQVHILADHLRALVFLVQSCGIRQAL